MKNGESSKTYYTLREAVKETGLSAYFLRNGCKAGTVPHAKSGNRYYINVPLLLERLNASESAGRGAEV